MGFVPLISQSLKDVKFQVLALAESPSHRLPVSEKLLLAHSTDFSAPCASSLNLPRSFLVS